MLLKKTEISYRRGIQKHLQEIRPDVDIIFGTDFREGCEAFKGVTMELKRHRRGRDEHNPPITIGSLSSVAC